MANLKNVKVALDRNLTEQNDRLIAALGKIYLCAQDSAGVSAAQIRAILRISGFPLPTN